MLLPTAAMVAAVPRPPSLPQHSVSDFEQREAAAACAMLRYER